MNFYIGNDIENLNLSQSNIRIDGVIFNYFYSERINLNIFYDINHYEHVLLKKDDILKLIEDCDIILSSELIKSKYLNHSGWMMGNPNNAFLNLKNLCLEAIKENKNIISLGD